MTLKLVLAHTLPLLLCACSGGGATNEDSVRALKQRDADFNSAVSVRDVAKIGEFYANDAVLMPTAEPVIRGRGSIVEEWAQILAIPGFENSNTLEGARIAGAGDMAYTYGSYRTKLMGEDGKITVEPGKWITILTKGRDGQWMIAMDTYNTDIPPPDHK